MASDKGLTGTPFDAPICNTPAPGEATTSALSGGFDLGEGSQKETANMSELPPVITLTDVKDGPAAGSTVAVDPGVASPMNGGRFMDKV